MYHITDIIITKAAVGITAVINLFSCGYLTFSAELSRGYINVLCIGTRVVRRFETRVVG
jgi:hypothetical protein